MNENVKIKIQEIDRTSPAGNGIDSTDIAFIPGFSCLATAPKNVPTLITSTREFDHIFGTEPRKLTTRDVEKYPNLGFIAGDPDRSYVFAKELLFQGMPVVYSNLMQDNCFEDVTSLSAESSVSIVDNDFREVTDSELVAKIERNDVSGTFSDANDHIILEIKNPKQTNSVEKTVRILLKTDIAAEPSEGNIPKITTYETAACIVNRDNSTTPITCFINLTDTIIKQHDVELISDTQVELVNSSSEEKHVGIELVLDVPVSISSEETCIVKLQKFKNDKSVLDAFYSNDNKMLEQLSEEFIADKSVYSVKYITSGGYPSIIKKQDSKGNDVIASSYASEMVACAKTRGDAVALIDYYLNPEDKPFATDGTSFYEKIHKVASAIADGEYGAAMYPWATYNCVSTLKDNSLVSMPASFAYLLCLAKAIKTSPNWLAMAGVSRGLVPAINTLLVPNNVISNNYAEQMQPKFGVDNHNISVNTITNIRPYGLTLWGNRTLKPVDNEGTVALNFLNTRNMLSDIKKLLYTTAKSCMFEQNSTDLWLKFKNGVEPLLRRLKAGNGISEYQIVRGTTKYNGDPLTKGEIAAVIKIVPMHAVEYFELTVEINDQDITVS